MQNTDHNKMIQQGLDTVASGCDHTSLSFSPMAVIFINRFESTGRAVPPLSWQRLATEELIKEQYNAVGINNVAIHHEPLGYQMTDPKMWWDVVWNAGWRS